MERWVRSQAVISGNFDSSGWVTTTVGASGPGASAIEQDAEHKRSTSSWFLLLQHHEVERLNRPDQRLSEADGDDQGRPLQGRLDLPTGRLRYR